MVQAVSLPLGHTRELFAFMGNRHMPSITEAEEDMKAGIGDLRKMFMSAGDILLRDPQVPHRGTPHCSKLKLHICRHVIEVSIFGSTIFKHKSVLGRSDTSIPVGWMLKMMQPIKGRWRF